MPEFSALEYKEKLQRSNSCEECEKVPMPKLGPNREYIFISYSHKDYKKVYSDLADLYEKGISFWYDGGLPAGKNWDDVVRERMTDSRCVGVIFYLSENLFLSRSIQTEIRITCGEDVESSNKQMKEYFSVNLTDLRPNEMLRSCAQQLLEDGCDMEKYSERINILTKTFPAKATYLPFSHTNHSKKLVEQIKVVFGIKPNYNLYDFRGAEFFSGTGIIRFESGAVYEGAYENGRFSGKGKMTWEDGSVYEGEWIEGKRHGEGRIVYSDGSVYKGNWVAGRREGWGKYSYKNGSIYKGYWVKDQPNGRGTMTYTDGATYEGEWKQGKKHGKGQYTYPNGVVYKGVFVEGKADDHGEYIWPD